MKKLASFAALLVVAALAAAGCGASAEGDDLAETGKPVHLTVGYQPYYSEAWSALVLSEKELWKDYLPEGSTVDFEVGLQGSIIVSQMLAGKEQIGYLGDMPAIVGVSKRDVGDLRIVANVGTSSDQCGVLLVKNDAPEFKSSEEAVQWLDGKTVATPQGSCADRVAQGVFQQAGVEPGTYLNQTNDLITSDFESGSIDAASVWEPNASKLIEDGLARRVASGEVAGLTTSAFLAMSKDLIDQRPDIVEGWLKAELAAEQWLSDPANAEEMSKIAVSLTEGFTEQSMHDALYKKWPATVGGDPAGVKLSFPFVIDAETEQLVDSASQFLYDVKSLSSPDLPPGALDPAPTKQVLGTDPTPVGQITATG
ncbi:MAG TPA: ABC transporter substrate-binding protein [Solirubrobacterales bacterium]|nr:ABC transporter substrate-binding protein [Solirubrobacterales bacterium]